MWLSLGEAAEAILGHRRCRLLRRALEAQGSPAPPIGSGKAASGHPKTLERPFVASEYKRCSEIRGVNSTRRDHDPSSATTSSGCFIADAG